MKNIYTKCNSYEQANELGHYIVSHGFEGLYNDSYRYCEMLIKDTFNDNVKVGRPYLYVGVGYNSLEIGRTPEEMARHKSTEYIEDVDTFKRVLENKRVYTPIKREWKLMGNCAPNDLLHTKVEIFDDYIYASRNYFGTVTDVSYSDRGVVLTLNEEQDIQTSPYTKIWFEDDTNRVKEGGEK